MSENERCAKCGQEWGEHVGDGHDEPICPDTPASACWKCHGDGLDYNEPGAPCPECKGSGRTVKDSLQVAPAPASAGPVLTRAALEGLLDEYNEHSDHEYGDEKKAAAARTAILAHDAALRAEVERLRLGNVDRARMPIETRRLIDIANEQRARAEAAEAEVARLRKALAEQPKCIYKCDNCEEIANG